MIMGKGEVRSISDLAFRLDETEEAIRAAIDHLCGLEYCRKIEPTGFSANCSGGCSKSCTKPTTSNFYFWEMTPKGEQFLKQV